MLCPTCSFFLVSVLRFWNILQHFFTRIGGKAISIVLPLEFWAQLRESLSPSIHFPHFLTVSSHLMEFFDYCDPSSVYSCLSWGGAGLNAESLSNNIIILQHGARTNKAEGPFRLGATVWQGQACSSPAQVMINMGFNISVLNLENNSAEIYIQYVTWSLVKRKACPWKKIDNFKQG